MARIARGLHQATDLFLRNIETGFYRIIDWADAFKLIYPMVVVAH